MRKAFTLVELLAVLVILGIVSLITVPIVTKTIASSKESMYKNQVNEIEKVARNWFIKDSVMFDESIKTVKVSVSYLVKEGYVESSKIINPKTDEDMIGCVVITESSKQYYYEYTDTDCTCKNDTTCKSF